MGAPDVAWVTSDAVIDEGIVYQGTSDSYFLVAIDIKDGRVL